MFANWFVTQKNKLGMTYEDVAREMELRGFSVTRQTVSMWGRGERMPNLKDAEKIKILAQILHVPTADIIAVLGYENPLSQSSDAKRAAELIELMPPEIRQKAMRMLEALAE